MPPGEAPEPSIESAAAAGAVGGVARLELAAARAIRARDVAVDDGWWLRADDDGVVRRANAVFAGAAGVDPLGRKLDRVEARYEERERPVRLQLSPASAPHGLVAMVRERGYHLETPVLVMARGGAAVLDGCLVGLFDVVTDPGALRRGHARRVTAAPLAWGAASGARWAYLQVAEHNLPARALYEGLASRAVYRYVDAIRPGRGEPASSAQ